MNFALISNEVMMLKSINGRIVRAELQLLKRGEKRQKIGRRCAWEPMKGMMTTIFTSQSTHLLPLVITEPDRKTRQPAHAGTDGTRRLCQCVRSLEQTLTRMVGMLVEEKEMFSSRSCW